MKIIGTGFKMKVFAVMGCFDYESDQVIVTFNNREEADNYRNFLDFQTKMGACELHFDYYWVQEQTVYNTLKEFEAFQAEQERLEEQAAFDRAEELIEESRTINNPFIEALGELK